MGTVYLAHDDDLDRPVALKLLSRAVADNTDVQARFLREARTAARLNHPNIVSIYARGVHDRWLYISMQFVEGTDAAAPISGGRRMPVGRAVRIISETAAALDFAHRHGVLHRDVKPANILLAQPEPGQRERVLLADFGIAKALEDSAHQTRTGHVLGSFQYAAPEQLDPQVTLDHRVDVYSLGATLYHLLTGQLPFPGTTIAQLIGGHLHHSPPRPSAHGVSAEFDRIISVALAKDREDRYPSCGLLAADLRTAFTKSVRPAPPLAPPPPMRSPSPPESTLHITPETVRVQRLSRSDPQSPALRDRLVKPVVPSLPRSPSLSCLLSPESSGGNFCRAAELTSQLMTRRSLRRDHRLARSRLTSQHRSPSQSVMAPA